MKVKESSKILEKLPIPFKFLSDSLNTLSIEVPVCVTI